MGVRLGDLGSLALSRERERESGVSELRGEGRGGRRNLLLLGNRSYSVDSGGLGGGEEWSYVGIPVIKGGVYHPELVSGGA